MLPDLHRYLIVIRIRLLDLGERTVSFVVKFQIAAGPPAYAGNVARGFASPVVARYLSLTLVPGHGSVLGLVSAMADMQRETRSLTSDGRRGGAKASLGRRAISTYACEHGITCGMPKGRYAASPEPS
jgi:hypothetical protein